MKNSFHVAGGTRARRIIGGPREIPIFDEEVALRAKWHTDGFSSHADPVRRLAGPAGARGKEFAP